MAILTVTAHPPQKNWRTSRPCSVDKVVPGGNKLLCAEPQLESGRGGLIKNVARAVIQLGGAGDPR